MSHKLVSMKMSKSEAKNEFGGIDEDKGPRFPHGLTIRLNNDSLEKLGMDQMPHVGEEFIVVGIGKVDSSHENKRQSGVDRSVSIQLEEMEVGPVNEATAVDAVSAAIKDA